MSHVDANASPRCSPSPLASTSLMRPDGGHAARCLRRGPGRLRHDGRGEVVNLSGIAPHGAPLLSGAPIVTASVAFWVAQSFFQHVLRCARR